ncbi:MAG TPA: thiamine-phosphate kinase, partial [Burkholderiaceae bacterium]|nr:thiamine-phosphate kinase [Burkholderiaceae bacterium]
VGATLAVDALPRGAVLRTLPMALQREFTLAGGDDYELLFSAPPDRVDAVAAAARTAGVGVTRVGRIESEPGLRLVDANGAALANRYGSFDHFKSP